MDVKALENLISAATEAVLKQLGEAGEPACSCGAVVIVPGYVPDEASLDAYLKRTYGGKATYWLLEGASQVKGADVRYVKTNDDEKRLLDAVLHGTDVVLVFPPLWLLGNIAQGDDRYIAAQAVIKALLWGKKAAALIDFVKPGFQSGSFFETLSDTLRAMEDMGVCVVSLPLSALKQADEKTLVTEADVLDAAKSGEMRVKCAPGAVITPLARDKANELGVTID